MDVLIWVATVVVIAALLWATQTGQRLVILLPIVAVGLAVVLLGLYFDLGGPVWPYVTIVALVAASVLPRSSDRGRRKSDSDPTP